MKRLQNRIAESRFALPVTAVLMLAVWFLMGLDGEQSKVKLLLFALSTYLMVELNNRNALVRIYSRMVSCSFLVLMTMAANILTDISVWVVQLCMIVTLTILLQCYQDKRTQGRMFYAFFFIGVASVFFIQILFFVPFLWILICTNLMAFSVRGLLASFLGIIMPYWFWAGYLIYCGDIQVLIEHVLSITNFEPLFHFENLSEHTVVTFFFITLMAFIGIVHFLRNSYKDKIRTRMIYEIIILLTLIVFTFIILQPQHIEVLLGIMLINASVLIAHYIALTRTWLTNVSFAVIVMLSVALMVYNIWMPSLLF